MGEVPLYNDVKRPMLFLANPSSNTHGTNFRLEIYEEVCVMNGRYFPQVR